ncbi:unnamed protein product [Zymoseptoria tritici ST99CH_1A5]|uniref:ML-like domain-containing protein n=2 Tax=Zymoseptoria tritici TaxID=1047171 RepID=A0A1X7S7W0_ZYMT9|nr:unnamed protein product [Zymoseptoria tritici ST99CH_3D7]SMR64096.1 unnamed protein product [Zymoseptoria tritici ST99CH_3D1]SMY29445.1 unnamed protein product [Zymoseptoria tritici ST99CH_1A5]
MAPPHTWTATLTLALLTTSTTAQRQLNSTSFSTCISNSSLTADSFSATIYPDTDSFEYDWIGANSFVGNDTISVIITVASKVVYNDTLDPCLSNAWAYFCPASKGEVAIMTNTITPNGTFEDIPESVFTQPGLEASFEVQMTNSDTGAVVGCLRANLTNGVEGNGASDENAGSSNATTTEGTNGSGSSNESSTSGSGSGGGSGASTAYLNWTLLLSALGVLMYGTRL